MKNNEKKKFKKPFKNGEKPIIKNQDIANGDEKADANYLSKQEADLEAKLDEMIEAAFCDEPDEIPEPEYVNVCGVRFKDFGKMYYFDPGDLDPQPGEHVIVETVSGLEFATVSQKVIKLSTEKINTPLRPVIRIATYEDIVQVEKNKELERSHMQQCAEEIKKVGLDMQLVSCERNFEGSKVTFYFTADGRVDFRELVKRLASLFRTRIELRQVGVRDKAKLVGGIGPCGRVICCSAHLSSFIPVSIKMAKEQGIALSPTKISGVCGRLMCCLKYEQDLYEELRKKLPNAGCEVITPDGNGVITETNVLTEKCKVKVFDDDGSFELKEYGVEEITVTKYHKSKKTPKNEQDELEYEMLED